jgi:hypothetical protein
MSSQPRASSELSPGTEGHWSQFSLPAVDEGDWEGEGNELQNQGEQSLASMSDDRRSFPELMAIGFVPKITRLGFRRVHPPTAQTPIPPNQKIIAFHHQLQHNQLMNFVDF